MEKTQPTPEYHKEDVMMALGLEMNVETIMIKREYETLFDAIG